MLDFNTAAVTPPASDWRSDEARLEALRAALRRNAPALVRDLYPAARYQGHEARIGSAAGEAGESMSIQLTGEKAGQWYDHNPMASEREGDLITLWRMGQGYEGERGFWQAVEDLELYLGLRNDRPRWTGAVARVVQERAAQPRPPQPEKTLEATYIYTDASGQEVLAKVVRYRLSNGKKTFAQWRASDGAWKSPEVRPLYNLPGVAGEGTVVLVEGEKAADALNAIGVTATTVMGGSDTILDKTDFTPLAGKRVILWPDNDEPGRYLMGRIEPILQSLGCTVLTVDVPANMPEKWDAADATQEQAMQLLRACLDREAATAAKASRGLRFVQIEDLENLPPPTWIVDGLIPEKSLAVVVGPPASLKTFVVLDWSLSIATGETWLGKEMGVGPVVYVAGEGQHGMANRVLGWLDHRGLRGQEVPFHIVPQGVAMPTGQADELLALIATLPKPPVLIVLDTLARTFGAGDENSQKDMNAYVAACDRLKEATGATVLVIHHTGKEIEKGARGSTVLTGAADAVVGVKRSGDQLTLINTAPVGKQKDADEHADIHLRRVVHRFRRRSGEEATTLLLIPDTPFLPGDEPAESEAEGTGRASPARDLILKLICEAHERGEPSLGFTQIVTGTGLGKGTVSKALKALVELGKIGQVPNFHPPRYRAMGV